MHDVLFGRHSSSLICKRSTTLCLLLGFLASLKGHSQGAVCRRDPQADVAAFQEKGGHILVGTPGRLSDIFERSRVLDAKHIEVLVLDEADRLLDAGYGKHLENLMRKLPKQRRTGKAPSTILGSDGSVANRATRL